MELREDACGHWESRGRNTQGFRLLPGAQQVSAVRDQKEMKGLSKKTQEKVKE